MLRLVVIHHRSQTLESVQKRFFLTLLLRSWASQGVDIVHAFGADAYESADVTLLHVDLSIVPSEYVDLGRRYPVCMNGGITDIRKSIVSALGTRPGDGYTGKVIVKTNLNFGGRPERRIASLSRMWRCGQAVDRSPQLRSLLPPRNFKRYKVFDKDEVPDWIWAHSGLFVERFLPEREGDAFVIYNTFVLGQRDITWRCVTGKMISSYGDTIREQRVETPDAVIEFCRRHHLDYGKVDFVMHQGKPLIFDANKTPGGPFGDITASHLAPGLEFFVAGSEHIKVNR